MTQANETAGCDFCNKSSLSLLLLRPSPIAKDPRLKPPLYNAVSVQDAALIQGLIPDEPLTESDYSLRLLRPGYVHIYLPDPPPGMDQWLVYRVSENADIIPQTTVVFSKLPAPSPCAQVGHNTLGMRLLPIPRADEISELWISYSANYWTEAIRQKYPSELAISMQRVVLRAPPGHNAFKPSAEALKAQVQEFSRYRSSGAQRDQDFPLVPLADQAAPMAQQLIDAAACHPKTAGYEQAVVLNDPAGLAIELNGLRLRRYELAEQYLLQPEIRQPLEVNKLIQTLKGGLIADFDQKALEAVSPLRFKAAFDASKVPAGSHWEVLSEDERKLLNDSASGDSWLSSLLLKPYRYAFDQQDLGRVVFPDQQARADAWAAEEVEKAWADMTNFYDEERRQQWQADFEADLQRLHTDEVARYEADWNRALQRQSLFTYFEKHFDPLDQNLQADVVLTGCSPGATFIREVALSYTPEPYTEAPAATFERQLDADIGDSSAHLLRAMAGNQKSLIDILLTEQQDQTYDFMKGLIGEYLEATTVPGQQTLSPKVPKMVAWLSNQTLAFSMGISSVLASIAVSATASAKALTHQSYRFVGPTEEQYRGRVNRAQAMALVHRASEHVLDAALNRRTAHVPVVVMVTCDADTALLIMRNRGQPLKRNVAKDLRKQKQVSMALFTDSNTLANLRANAGELRDAVAKGAHNVVLNEQAHNLKQLGVDSIKTGAAVTLPLARFEKFYAAHRAEAAKAPALLKSWMQGRLSTLNNLNGYALRHATLSIEGRLAIGAMIIQGLGVWNHLRAMIVNGVSPERSRDEWLMVANGTAGFLGGFLELSAVAWDVRLKLTGAAAFGRGVATLTALRAGAFGMGFAANVISAWINFREAEKLKKQGQPELGNLLHKSIYLFLGGSIPLGLVAADFMMKSFINIGLVNASNKAAQQLGKLVATRLGTAAFGLSFPGVGWALTVVAVGQTVYVVMNTSAPLQHWLKGCYFGKDSWWKVDVPRRATWEEEEAAFIKVVKILEDAEKIPTGVGNA